MTNSSSSSHRHQQHNNMVSVPLGGISTKSGSSGGNGDNGNDSDDDVSSISDGDRGERWKKNRPAVFIIYYRLLLRFKMLPMPLQLVVAFIIGYIIMTSIRQAISVSSISSSNGGVATSIVKHPGSNFDNAHHWERPQHVHQEEMKPRILQLLTNEKLKSELVMYSPLDQATSRIEENNIQIPQIGSRKIKEKYIELPDMEMKRFTAADELEKDGCHKLGDWQLDHKPTCNVIHEIVFDKSEIEMPATAKTTATSNADVAGADEKAATGEEDNDVKKEGESSSLYKNYQLIAGGAFRHVWMFREYDGTQRVLKTLRVDSERKKFDLRSFDRHRRDALSMDQLTWSPLVVDIYAYCTNSAIFDFGEGGDLTELFERRKPSIINKKNKNDKTSQLQQTIRPLPNKETMLQIAYNVSLSLAHAHNPDKQGRATLAHTDIKPNQFLYQDGYYKLTDFNRVRFLTWNDWHRETCGFHVGKNGGIWRAPEEYAYEAETEKVDVFSLGNVLYYMITEGMEPWEIEDISSKEVYKRVMDGKRAKFPQEVLDSTHPYEKYVLEAIQLCWIHDPKKRASAQQVADKLAEGIKEL